MASDGSKLRALVLFGALTSVLYFVSLLLFPDSSWLTLSAFLQFQPTRLAAFAGCFALGAYAQARGWFADPRPLGSLSVWGGASVVLLGCTLVTGQPLFADAANPPSLPLWQLLAYALSRSFLLVSLLILLVSFGVRYWNRSNGVDRQLSATSYDIYLTHIWLVIVAQEGLLEWTGGPALAKMAIAFLVALGPSFAISKWVVGRYPRVVVALILALFVFCIAVRP